MYNETNAFIIEIKNKILSQFIDADIDVFYDNEQDEYFISTKIKELYYSDDYGKLIFEINQKYLWGKGIFNVYFILREDDLSVNKMSFSFKNETIYKQWKIDNVNFISFDKKIDINSFSLAA